MQHSFWNKGFFVAAIVAVVAMAASAAAADWKETAIAEVKASYVNNFETVPVGKVLNARFDNPKWEAFESGIGEKVVAFTGNIPLKTRLSALQRWVDWASAEGQASIMNMNGMAYEALGKEKYESLFAEAAERNLSENNQLAVVWGRAFPSFWEKGQDVEFQWVWNGKNEEWRLEHFFSEGWKNHSQDNVFEVIYSP